MPLPIMSLTDAAAERVREIMDDSATPVVGVRIGIKDAGCAGQSYTLNYVSAPVAGDDHVFERLRVVIFSNKADLYFVEGRPKSGLENWTDRTIAIKADVEGPGR